jgi:hypothetical protein
MPTPPTSPWLGSNNLRHQNEANALSIEYTDTTTKAFKNYLSVSPLFNNLPYQHFVIIMGSGIE